jgi:group I intron endonuclease
MYMIIYKITNKTNGKTYIGKTEKSLNERWKHHLKHVKKGTNRYLYDAIRHYGINNFSIEKIEKVTDKSELNQKEIYWIKQLKSNNKNFGYNMTEGGDGGKMSDVIYKRLADQKRGIPLTDQHKKNVSDSLKGVFVGRKLSKKWKRKISETLKKRYKNGELKTDFLKIGWKKGKDHPMYGKHHTKKTKKRLSKVFTGWNRNTPENIEKLKINSTGENNWQYKHITKNDLLGVILNEKLTTDEICDRLNICRWTLYSKCKKLFGISSIEKIKKQYEFSDNTENTFYTPAS